PEPHRRLASELREQVSCVTLAPFDEDRSPSLRDRAERDCPTRRPDEVHSDPAQHGDQTRAVGREVQKIDAQAETQSLHPAPDRELLVSDGVAAEVRFLAVHTPERIELVSVQQQLGARGLAAVPARAAATIIIVPELESEPHRSSSAGRLEVPNEEDRTVQA